MKNTVSLMWRGRGHCATLSCEIVLPPCSRPLQKTTDVRTLFWLQHVKTKGNTPGIPLRGKTVGLKWNIAEKNRDSFRVKKLNTLQKGPGSWTTGPERHGANSEPAFSIIFNSGGTSIIRKRPLPAKDLAEVIKHSLLCFFQDCCSAKRRYFWSSRNVCEESHSTTIFMTSVGTRTPEMLNSFLNLATR